MFCSPRGKHRLRSATLSMASLRCGGCSPILPRTNVASLRPLIGIAKQVIAFRKIL